MDRSAASGVDPGMQAITHLHHGAWKQNPQDRLIAGAATGIMVGMMGYMLVTGLSANVEKRVEEAMVLLNLREAPPPPIVEPKPRVEPHHAKAAGRASPKNLRQKATPVAAPKPKVVLPPPPPVVAAPVPNRGAAAASGASSQRGPGQGAGGEGDGTGSGGYGDGEGDGGAPPRQIAGKLRARDLPPELVLPGTHRVGVEYHVTAQGSVDACRTTETSGNGALDRFTCRLIQERFRFRPSRNADGRPVGAFIEEDHSWIIDAPRDRDGSADDR